MNKGTKETEAATLFAEMRADNKQGEEAATAPFEQLPSGVYQGRV